MSTSTLSISEKQSQRTAFEQELNSFLAEVKAAMMVCFEANPNASNDPYVMLGRLEKETFEVKQAISERHPSKLKSEMFDVVVQCAYGIIQCKNVRATDLI
ncbi:hypothetical protein [Pontibacter burrus]|uniref:Uncharacterized protein n=1 Tax=Pontibacter burrus TaxID=2704466 RepID=A0A6B3LJP6_9BACT|nr:hypothetical protein [Pontibacter burrus]NEM96193.1 hypothetical protein [Pontibacter burrus]